jgi:hypothetical protein
VRGERQVCRGVLVSEVDARLAGERAELLQRVMHHLHRAFEHAAAPCTEQRVTGERSTIDDVGDRAERVPGVVDDACPQAAELDRVAVLDEPSHVRQPRPVARMRDDLDAVRSESSDAPDVVPVMVSEPNRLQLDPLSLDHSAHDCVLTRVHTGCVSAFDN